MTGKEDLAFRLNLLAEAMKNQRSFSLEFKRQVVEELLSRGSGAAQLCRRYNIGASLLYHWKKQYSIGKFNNEPDSEAALKDRVEKLERLVGKLTLENEFLKSPSLQRKDGPAGWKREIVSKWKSLVTSVKRGCVLMKLARSSFYYKIK